jgi:hypothetical protein
MRQIPCVPLSSRGQAGSLGPHVDPKARSGLTQEPRDWQSTIA